MIDIEYDIHYGKPTTDVAIEMLKSNIKLSKSRRHRLIRIVVGYGSTGGTHRIKDAALEQLEDWKNCSYIKDYILGSDLNIFNPIYQRFKYKDMFSQQEKDEHNPGAIYIIL